MKERRSETCSCSWRNRRSCLQFAALLLLVLFCAGCQTVGHRSAFDARGNQFIGFDSFSTFAQAAGERAGEVVMTSPEIATRINWNELVASWNAEAPAGAYLKIEARAIYANRATKFYMLGLWSSDPALQPRESVLNQQDDNGNVATDTLVLREPCDRIQVRLTLVGKGNEKPEMKFLGLCLTDTKAALPPLPPNRSAWGKTIPVPEISQMPYAGGESLCSPANVAMILSYWSQKLKRPELNLTVSEIAKQVYDPNWPGTGNWPFNTAFAGSHRGIRAYVARLSDVSELEDWIAQGIPVSLSLCYNLLRGTGEPGNGHLVVCVGFTKDGNVIINDPGTTLNVRKTFPRKNLIAAWAYSRNTAYFIYPENATIPADRFGHWERPF